MNKVRTERIEKKTKIGRIAIRVALAIFLVGLIGSCVVSDRFTLANVPVEVAELRTETSRTYYLGDDQYALYTGKVCHYKDAGGAWQQIDNAIVGDQMLKDSYNIRLLQDTFNAGQILEWSVGAEYVRFQPMPLGWTNDLDQIEQIAIPQAVTGSIVNTPMPLIKDGDGYIQGSINWPDAYGSGIDFSWTCNPHELSKLLTIDNPPPSPAQYIIDGGDPVLRLSFVFAPSASMEIYTDGVLWDKSTRVTTYNEVEFRKDGATLWIFRPAFAWDSSGELLNAEFALRKVGSKLYVDILVPYDWLSQAVYPVYIDPTLAEYSSTSDGHCFAWDAVYNTAWTATSGTVLDSEDYMSIGQYESFIPSWFHIRRPFFYFDTSSIGGGSTIDSATLNLYGKLDASVTDFDITIQDGQPTYPRDPMVNADYNKSYYAGDGGSLATSGFSTGSYNVITLNADGRSWINKTGDTKLCVRSSRDISGTAPISIAATEYVDVYAAEYAGTSRDPYIYIVYSPAADPPTVITSAATNVEDTTATLNGEVTDTGDDDPTVTVFWGDEDGETTPENWDNSSAPTSPAQPQGAESFYKDATGLPTGTSIFFTARAVNVAGTDWGSTRSFLTKPAAPTNVDATDGDHTDKVVITWTKSTGATGYKIYRDDELIDTVGDVATYDDTGADAPTITAGSTVASDGSSTAHVSLSLSGTSTSVGTTHTYKLKALNGSGDSDDSDTDTGYRGVGSLTYQWQRSAADSDADYSNITGATSATHDDTGAPAPTITAGSTVASDGSSTAHVALSLSGTSTSVGDGRYYQCVLDAAGAAQQISDDDRGYRDVGSLTYQWQRSAADSDADYSNITGATSATYDDTEAPAGNITAGSTVASDGTSTAHVSLSLSGTSTSVGDGRYYQCVLNAAGAAQQISDDDRGYRDVGSLTYQWQRSAADSDADYSNITGATSATHDDTGAPAPNITAGNATASDGTDCAHVALNLTDSASNAGDGRYYRCALNATGADSKTSAVDRGYRGTSTLSYQWYRSSNDEAGNYSTISGGTSVSYNDTGGVYTTDGRYYLCQLDMSGAISQNSSADRGYMLLPDPPTVTAYNATGIGNDSARLRGDILDTGCAGGYVTLVGFEWGISTGNYSYSWNSTGEYELGLFYRIITGLQGTTHYYWRAFARTAGGTNYSAEFDFLTGSLPLAPEDFTITQVGGGSISLNWTKGVGADMTVIVVNESGYPESRTDGYIVYSGNGTGVILTGLTLGMTSYYYRAWSFNEEGYSPDYAEASIGDPISVASIIFVIALCGFALWKTSWIRLLLSICILIWAVFVVPYDLKVAAPLLCLGTLLSVSSIFTVYGLREKQTAPKLKEELIY